MKYTHTHKKPNKQWNVMRMWDLNRKSAKANPQSQDKCLPLSLLKTDMQGDEF